MDSPAPQLELVRPWRLATLVISAVAALELVLLVVSGLVLAGRSLAPRVNAEDKAPAVRHVAATPAPKQTFQPPKVVAKLPRSKTGVMIMNGNGVQGAAAEAASLVSARGYVVKDVGNAPRQGYRTWRLMYGPGFAGEAKRFARDLNLSPASVGPLDGMQPRQLHGAQLLLILGASR